MKNLKIVSLVGVIGLLVLAVVWIVRTPQDSGKSPVITPEKIVAASKDTGTAAAEASAPAKVDEARDQTVVPVQPPVAVASSRAKQTPAKAGKIAEAPARTPVDSGDKKQDESQKIAEVAAPVAEHHAERESAGHITHLSGVLTVLRSDGKQKMLSVKSEVMQGDTLRTEVGTYARIKFIDGGEVVLRPETVFKIESYAFNASQKQSDSVMLSLLRGGLRSVSGMIGKRNPEKFKMSTPVATVGIRGTHFGVLLCNNDCGGIATASGRIPENGVHTDTVQGSIVVSNSAGSVEFPAGSFGYTPSLSSAPMTVPPSQGFQIVMPTSISSNKAGGLGLGSSNNAACAIK